jgi:hypothetical protein
LFLTSLCGFLFFGEWKINTRQFEIPTSQRSVRLAEIGFWLLLALLSTDRFPCWVSELVSWGFRGRIQTDLVTGTTVVHQTICVGCGHLVDPIRLVKWLWSTRIQRKLQEEDTGTRGEE